MDIHKTRTIIIYTFVAVFGLILANVFFRSITPSKKLDKTITQPENKQDTYVVKPKGTLKPSKSTGFSFKLRQDEEGEFLLNGIFLSDDLTYALINNRIVKEGEQISGAAVKKINVDSVELDISGETLTLKTPR